MSHPLVTSLASRSETDLPQNSLCLTLVRSGNTPSTSLIFSIDTLLLAFSDQHLDLCLVFPGPGMLRQSGTAVEPSGVSLPPQEHQGEGLHAVF